MEIASAAPLFFKFRTILDKHGGLFHRRAGAAVVAVAEVYNMAPAPVSTRILLNEAAQWIAVNFRDVGGIDKAAQCIQSYNLRAPTHFWDSSVDTTALARALDEQRPGSAVYRLASFTDRASIRVLLQ